MLSWLESHLCLIPLSPRRPGCSVVEGKDVTTLKVKALAAAADACWDAILHRDLDAFAESYLASFHAQVDMFPGMVHPSLPGGEQTEEIEQAIRFWSGVNGVLAWKLAGAGGGGYLALVVNEASSFCAARQEAIPLTARRSSKIR